MDLQEELIKNFGSKLERSRMFVSWVMKELATFTYAELSELHRTATYFQHTDRALASTLKERIGAEQYRRARGYKKTKIKLKKSKGKNKWLRELKANKAGMSEQKDMQEREQ